jgi:ABC-type transport system involved in multi-copper enzyme maturation permease subunit
MLPGPVFFHELRAVARRKRSYALRVVIGLFLLYIVVVPLYRGNSLVYSSPQSDGLSPHEMAMIGAGLFVAILWLQGAVILFLTPAFLAGAIAEDRQRKVLFYLLASPLSGAEIVLGKLAARLITLVVLVMVGLPVVSLCLFLGGIDPAEVWLAYGVSFASLYFLAGLSIFLSVYSARPRDAIIRAYLVGLAWFALPIIEQIILSVGGPLGTFLREAGPITEWVTGSSPCSFLIQGPFGGRPAWHLQAIWSMGLQVLYGTVLLAWSTLRLRRIEQGSRIRGFGWLGARTAFQPRRLFGRRACGDAPMIWKECSGTVASGGLVRTGLLLLVALAAVGGLGYWFVEIGIPAFQEVRDYGYGSTGTTTWRESLNTSGRIFTGILYVLMTLLLAASAATGITMEREKDTWISLISTPLEGREILTGKILGAFWRVRGILVALMLVWLIGLICGGVHPLGFLSVVVATSLYSLFAVLLGTSLSLRFKSSARSIAVTIAILMFLNVGYLFCCVPLMRGRDGVVFLAGFSPMIVVGSVFTFWELNEFLHGSSYQVNFGAQVIMLVFFSFFFYGSVAFGLLQDCLIHFEVAVDRPRLDFSRFPGRVSRRGIQFVDEIDADKDEIKFLETDEDLDDGLNP